MEVLLQTIKDSLTIGCLYALIALGYTMVYGILKFINFAHSDVVVLGALVTAVVGGKVVGQVAPGATAAWYFGPLVLVMAMAVCATVAFAVERLAYKPLRRAPRLNVLITAIGVSLLLQNAGQLPFLFGTEPHPVPKLIAQGGQAVDAAGKMVDKTVLVRWGAVSIRLLDLTIVGTAIVLMVVLEWLVFHTKVGRGMRAVSHDTRIASLMGVPVDRIISFTFVLGASLAGAGGFLYALRYQTVTQPADTGWALLGLKAFVAAVVGGIGNVRGAVLGAMAIAAVENFGAAYLHPGYTDVYVFLILILVLLFKPSGILGKAVAEKV
jgi:branched-chain amino acid transport system permease protein